MTGAHIMLFRMDMYHLPGLKNMSQFLNKKSEVH